LIYDHDDNKSVLISCTSTSTTTSFLIPKYLPFWVDILLLLLIIIINDYHDDKIDD
jgi:hypothetical protein